MQLQHHAVTTWRSYNIMPPHHAATASCIQTIMQTKMYAASTLYR